MELVVICNPDDRWEADRVVEEAKLKNLGAEVLHYENFQVQIVGGDLTIFYNNFEWKMSKWVVFRSANNTNNIFLIQILYQKPRTRRGF